MDGIAKSEASRHTFWDITIFYAEDGDSTHFSAAFHLLATYKDATCLMTANLVLTIAEEKGFGRKKNLFECIITTFCYTD